jgi:predicted DNA-binding transcriptional regulator YafY
MWLKDKMMNRMDRLTAILLFLQAGKRSASEIAQRFEVSRRTIQRDIDALCEMGIPIAAELGVTGGYSLPPDYFLSPLALTIHEAILLRLALSSVAQLNETPFKHERESLLAKIQIILSKHKGKDISQLQQTLSLNVPTRPYPTPFLDQLLASAHEQQWISVTYRSEKGVIQQTLLPMHVRTEAGLWYCEAYSYERQATRVYRIDRFQDVNRVPSPPQLDPPASPIIHIHASFLEIRIHLTARGVLRLEREPHLASHLQQQSTGEGLLSLRLRQEDYDWLISVLLSLGTDAKVLAPDELRLRVQHMAQEIAQHYTQL